MKGAIILLTLFSLSSVAAETTPTVRFNQSISFADDLNFENLGLAIDRQITSYKTSGLSGDIQFGSKVYPKTVLRESLGLLKSLTEEALDCQNDKKLVECSNDFDRKVNEAFAIYIPNPKSSEGSTKFTSYYSPDVTGSRVKSAKFNHAVYKKPSDPVLANSTRVEIDYHGALDGKGLEVFYVSDSYFDLYLLQVQGGGRINIINPDGSHESKYLSYDGKNARTFRMIYHYLVEQRYLTPETASVPNQRKFLEENPEKAEEVFGSCPSYVYFKESNEEPIGLDDIPLTEGRSLAMDSTIYKTTGLINFVKTVRASHVDNQGQVVKTPFSRFFIGQDTGGAIKGSARCDLYFGYGSQAELTAYNMNEIGEQYLLIKK